MILCTLVASALLVAQEPLQELDGSLEGNYLVSQALAVDGDWLIAGISREAGEADGEAQRPVAISYRRIEGRWARHSVLEAKLGAESVPRSRPRSVAIDDTTAVIGLPGRSRGSSGCALVFERKGDAWTHERTLFARHPDVPKLRTFGQSVAIEGDLIVVGAPVGEKFAFVFERAGGSWTKAATLEAPWSYGFGEAVSVAMGDVLVAAPGYFGARQPGAAYVYRKVDSDWCRVQVLRAHPGVDQGVMDGVKDNFGESMATSGDRLLVGSSQGYYESEPGCRAYLYRLVDDCWEAEATLPVEGGAWGVEVALDGNFAAVGAWEDVDVWCIQAFEQTDTWRTTRLMDDLRTSDYATPLAVSGRELFAATPVKAPETAKSSTVGKILVFDASGD